MPYFGIKGEGGDLVCVCTEEAIENVAADKMLGPGDWQIKEISEHEANQFAEEWVNGEIHPDYICPICEGPRSGSLRGEIVIQTCRNCGFES